MSTEQVVDSRPLKGKKGANVAPITTSGHTGPTTYFLKTEKEMERSIQRGRKPSRAASGPAPNTQRPDMMSSVADSSYGVQSLEDTISATFLSDSDLSRTSSHSTEHSPGVHMENGLPVSRKRKAGNPVHPKIKSAGIRIISSERPVPPSSATASPISARSAESPFRTRSLCRNSNSSSVNLSQPLTPVKMSPHPAATPDTPRSASPKSFRLSDEEASVADETGSQAVASSDGDQELPERTPQLVMPSLAMPARRPFTEHGKSMGRLKLMVLGPRGVGKTRFIQGLIRATEHIVHVDPTPTSTTPNQSYFLNNATESTTKVTEISASTKPCPTWWSEMEADKSSRRRMSTGDVLERNLCFIDTPGLDEDTDIHHVSEHLTSTLRRTFNTDSMTDSEVVAMLSGDGGVQIDAVIYLFEPTLVEDDDVASSGISPAQQDLLRVAARSTNFIPLVGKADKVDAETLVKRKEQVRKVLSALKIHPYQLGEASNQPLAVSSATGDDSDTIDASVLMSSQYMPPLVASELGVVSSRLFSSLDMARLRRLSASKALSWRKERPMEQFLQQKDLYLPSPQLGYNSPGVTSTGSMLDEPSKVLVPYGSSSYYRSVSPSISEASALPASTYSLTPYHEPHDPSAPIREVITAKWAQDLTRSREKETRRYMQMYHDRPSQWNPDHNDPEKTHNNALVAVRDQHTSRPGRGRLGGEFGVIDPRDPLGVLAFTHAFGRQGLWALQLAGSAGLFGAVCFCVVRYWIDLQEFWGAAVSSSGGSGMITATAIPPPKGSGSTFGWDSYLRAFFGWDR